MEHVNRYVKNGVDKAEEFEAQFSGSSVRKVSSIGRNIFSIEITYVFVYNIPDQH